MSNIQEELSKKLQSAKQNFISSLVTLDEQISNKIDTIRNEATIKESEAKIEEAENEKKSREELDNLKAQINLFMDKMLQRLEAIEQSIGG